MVSSEFPAARNSIDDGEHFPHTQQPPQVDLYDDIGGGQECDIQPECVRPRQSYESRQHALSDSWKKLRDCMLL